MLVACTRSALLINSKIWPYKKYVAGLAILAATTVISLTYSNWFDLLAFGGVVFGTLADFQSKAMMNRFFACIYHSMWLVFNIFTGSYGGMASTLINISSNLIGFWRHQLYPYLKTGDKEYFKI